MSSLPSRSYTPIGETLSLSERASRLWRMTRKELREILRDRRTIVTLIAMPLVLYPILSLIGNQFLLKEALSHKVNAPVQIFAVEGAREQALLERILNLSRERKLGRNDIDFETSEDAIATPRKFLQIKDGVDPVEVVRSGEVDVVIRVRPGARIHFDAEDDTVLDLELFYNPHNSLSRSAAEFLEGEIRNANEILLARRLEALAATQRPAPVMAAKLPIKSEEGAMAASIVQIIPLILILMTITGAVYPAIDLTAGERERGTLETLVSAPVPRLSLLMAKYFAVWFVACLTATANLVMLAATIGLSGLGPLLFGAAGLSWITVVQVFSVLLLFAAFFSALLLALSSFARSFKEAQAYLIPLMIVSIAPGVVSLMPSIRLDNPGFAIAPLLNIALLARGLFQGSATLHMAAAVVISTVFYSLAAIALAAQVFGAESVLYSSSSWSTLFMRPKKTRLAAPLSSAMFLLAILLPVQFTVSHLFSFLQGSSFTFFLILSGLATAVIYAGAPLLAAQRGNIAFDTGLQLRKPRLTPLIAALLLGLTLWPIAVYFASGNFEISPEMEKNVSELIKKIQETSPIIVVLCLAVAPAICEELFFRGYLLSSLRANMRDSFAILACGGLFGLFHLVNASSTGAMRLLPTTFLGIILSWVCVRSRSVIPGMFLHAANNGLVLLAASNLDALNQFLTRIGLQSGSATEAPRALALISLPIVAVLLAVIYISTRTQNTSADVQSPVPQPESAA